MGAPEGINNGHLARNSDSHSLGECNNRRLWWAYKDPFFPLDRLEPWTVVDSNGIADRSFILPSGVRRVWKLRHLEPAAPKVAARQDFYRDLKASIAKEGVRLPILVWQAPSGEYFLRYGASRVKVCRDLGLVNIPAVVCAFGEPRRDATGVAMLRTPSEVLSAFGELRSLGWLEVSHERIDAHHLEPVL